MVLAAWIGSDPCCGLRHVPEAESFEELYFAQIGSAAGALEQKDIIESARMLAKIPQPQRNWEWRTLASLIGAVPMTISSDQIDKFEKDFPNFPSWLVISDGFSKIRKREFQRIALSFLRQGITRCLPGRGASRRSI